MNDIYEEVKSDFGSGCVKRTRADGTVTLIPISESNSDYQAYLAYLAEQESA